MTDSNKNQKNEAAIQKALNIYSNLKRLGLNLEQIQKVKPPSKDEYSLKEILLSEQGKWKEFLKNLNERIATTRGTIGSEKKSETN